MLDRNQYPTRHAERPKAYFSFIYRRHPWLWW